MSHELTRFSSDILDKPQLITLEKFKEIESYLEDRNSGLYEMALDASKKKVEKEYLKIENGIAVLNVEGSLTYKPTIFQALCGGTSYTGLSQSINTIAEMEDVHTVMFDINSGGGMAYRAMETARNLRDICDKSNKKLVGYIDGMCASAAYVLGSVCHELYINPDAEAGSIGVVVRLSNSAEKDKKDGIKHQYITAGASKVPFDNDGNFKEDYLARLQERVDSLYDNFVSHVATYRNISEDVVRSTEAKVFSAKEALELGLVDDVVEANDFYEYLATVADNNTASSAGKTSNGVNMSVENDTTLEATADTEVVVEEKLEDVVDTSEQLEEVVEQTVEAAVVEENPLLAEMESLKAQLAELEGIKEQLASKEQEAAELAEQARQTKLANFTSQAEAWAFAGIDAQAFATSALEGSVPVEMFTAAMEKVQSTLAASEAMAELGEVQEDAPVAEAPKDGVEAALASNSKIKFKK